MTREFFGTDGVRGKVNTEPKSALAGATPYLRLFGNAAGGCMLADEEIGRAHV